MPGISSDFCDRAKVVASRLKEGYSWWQPGKRFNEMRLTRLVKDMQAALQNANTKSPERAKILASLTKVEADIASASSTKQLQRKTKNQFQRIFGTTPLNIKETLTSEIDNLKTNKEILQVHQAFLESRGISINKEKDPIFLAKEKHYDTKNLAIECWNKIETSSSEASSEDIVKSSEGLNEDTPQSPYDTWLKRSNDSVTNIKEAVDIDVAIKANTWFSNPKFEALDKKIFQTYEQKSLIYSIIKKSSIEDMDPKKGERGIRIICLDGVLEAFKESEMPSMEKKGEIWTAILKKIAELPASEENPLTAKRAEKAILEVWEEKSSEIKGQSSSNDLKFPSLKTAEECLEHIVNNPLFENYCRIDLTESYTPFLNIQYLFEDLLKIHAWFSNENFKDLDKKIFQTDEQKSLIYSIIKKSYIGGVDPRKEEGGIRMICLDGVLEAFKESEMPSMEKKGEIWTAILKKIAKLPASEENPLTAKRAEKAILEFWEEKSLEIKGQSSSNDLKFPSLKTAEECLENIVNNRLSESYYKIDSPFRNIQYLFEDLLKKIHE